MRRSVRYALGVAAVLTVGIALIPVTQALAANGASATFTKTSDWGTGYEGKYTIHNGSTGAARRGGSSSTCRPARPSRRSGMPP